MKFVEDIKNHKDSPLVAIGITVFIALAMIVATTVIFYRSGAYMTVKQIQAGANAIPSVGDDIDTTSPIKASDIDEFDQSFKRRLHNLDDSADFGPADLSNQNLGL